MEQARQEHKQHKKKKSKNEENSKNVAKEKHRNVKAFALQSAVKAERSFRRKQDIIAKRERAAQVDRTPLEPPPAVVAVVGPPKVGKTTLIRSLIRNYTRQNISQINGPITVVSGKNRRLTFIECNNDINSMIDVSKVADLVLIMVDASFGFEMETFEFLNICQSHGFPRIMGVLTHLDVITNPKKQRRTKKQLKHRFWTEIYAGAKLFYLSKFVTNEYLRNEVHNLARFISVMKFRPLQWATSHPYMLVDRVEDITNPEEIRQNPKCNRKVCLFGYSRGANFKAHHDVHIPGCGDFTLSNISFIPDPCPLPNKDKAEKKRRTLNEKEKCIYAPMSGVGGIVFDKDAIYIDLGGSHSNDQKDSGLSSEDQLVSALNQREALDSKLASTEMKLFSNAVPVSYGDAEIFSGDQERRVRRKVTFNREKSNEEDNNENSDNESEDGEESDYEEEEEVDIEQELAEDNDECEEKYEFFSSEDEDADLGMESERKNNWKDDLQQRASDAFYERIARVDNVQKLVYGNCTLEDEGTRQSEGKELSDGLFKMVQVKESAHSMKFTLNSLECTKIPDDLLIDFSSSTKRKFIRDCFVTGRWDKDEDASAVLEKDDEARKISEEEIGKDDDGSMYGDFEDFETGETFSGKTDNKPSDPELDNDEDDDPDDVDTIKQKKMRKKEQFDDEYDNLKSADVINPEEQTMLDMEKEKMKQQSEVRQRCNYFSCTL